MLDVLFGSKTRARLLRVLFVDGGRFRLLELQRKVGTSISSVQKELLRLEALGLVRTARVADARFIEADATYPLAAPLRALLEADSAMAETVGAGDERVNPAVRRNLAAIEAACRRHGAVKAALIGSATQPDPTVVPRDLDILVRFPSEPAGRAERYFGLLEELERIMGMRVEIIEEDSITNPVLREEFMTTQVVLYEAA